MREDHVHVFDKLRSEMQIFNFLNFYVNSYMWRGLYSVRGEAHHGLEHDEFTFAFGLCKNIAAEDGQIHDV